MTEGQRISKLGLGEAVSLRRIKPLGSLEARRVKTGVMFYWRFTEGGNTDRIPLGYYTPKSPLSYTPQGDLLSINAAVVKAVAKAEEHNRAKVAGLDGIRGAQAAEEAKAAAKAADDKVNSMSVGEVWALYIGERQPLWGERHYRDHVSLTKAGGVPAKRGTKGRGMTIAGPLHPLMAYHLKSLTTPVIEAWAKKEAKTRPTSARLAWRCLKAFLSWCAEQPEYAAVVQATNPAKTKKTREALGKAGVKQDALLREQLPAWFAAVRGLSNPTIAVCLQVLLLTGARLNEIMGMRWDDVNTKWKGITIRDKVEGERVIPLTPYVAQLLTALPKRNEWVFASVRTVKMDAKNEKRRARYHAARGQDAPQMEVEEASESGVISIPRSPHLCACKVAGIDGMTLHGLRRSFKSLSEWLELPAGVVAQIMGHKPSATAEKHYTVRPLDLLRLHHEKFEAWILEQAGIQFVANAELGKLRAVT